MPVGRTVLSLKRYPFAVVAMLIIGFLVATPSLAQSTNPPTNSPYAPGQPPPGVVDVAKWQERQSQNPPTPYTQPTAQQTYNTLNSYDATKNLDSWTKNQIATNTPMGRSFISGAALSNGQPNPFYNNAQTAPNWFVPATWSQPYMSWQGVQPSGFLPSASATTHSSSFATPVYKPTSYVPPYTSRPYQAPKAQSQSTASLSRRDTTRLTNLDPTRAQAELTIPSSRPQATLNTNAFAKITSDRERALAVSATAGDKLGQMVNHIGLAQLFVEQGNFAEALIHIAAAEPTINTETDPHIRLDLLRTKFAAHLQAGDFEQSLADNRAAMPILRSLNDERGEAETFLGSAWAFQSLGNVQEAVVCYGDAFTLFSNAADKEGQVRTRLGLGSLYQSLGAFDMAFEQYKNALPLASVIQQARIFASNADLLQAVGKPKAAIAHYKKAEALLPADGDPALKIAILTGMGRSLMTVHLFKGAEETFAQACSLAERTSNTAAKAGIIASTGELQYWIAVSSPLADPSYHLKQALRNYEEALPLMRAIGDRSGEIGVLTNSGLVYDAKSKPKEALSYYVQALDKMEQLQTQARLEEFRGKIAAQSAALYARAIQLEVRTHQFESAFALSERARARIFLDQLGNMRIDDIKQASPEFLAREDQLRRENILLERQLGQERSKPGVELNSERTATLQARLATVRASYETLINGLKLSNPKYAAFLSVSPITLAEAQSHLDTATTLVSFYTEPDETLAFVLTKSTFKVKELEVGQTDLIHEISIFRDFAGASEVSPSLQILHKALIAPIRSQFKTSKLVFVPNGVLHDLPFAALTPDGHHFLSDDFSISYLPSVSVLSYLHSKPRSSSPQALVVVSNQEEGFPLLTSADDEGESVASFFNTKPLMGKEATAGAVRTEAASFDILHLVAHFETDGKNPMASRILLSRGEQGDDSPLDLAGVYGLSLRKTDLVVLSGCQSQTGKRTRGDDIIGLSQAFLYAGSPSVVASLWSVDDDATKLLMVAFYSRLKQGLSKTDALKSAQAEVRQKYPSPYYWAAFVLTGDPGSEIAPTTTAAN
jgi:CHAT domain-containing protein/tetratricopeptide (TPR) repeat protein